MTWGFDVAVSDHDLLRQGVVVGHWRHFKISSETYSDHLAASEAAILWGFHYGYVTDCVCVDWPEFTRTEVPPQSSSG